MNLAEPVSLTALAQRIYPTPVEITQILRAADLRERLEEFTEIVERVFPRQADSILGCDDPAMMLSLLEEACQAEYAPLCELYMEGLRDLWMEEADELSIYAAVNRGAPIEFYGFVPFDEMDEESSWEYQPEICALLLILDISEGADWHSDAMTLQAGTKIVWMEMADDTFSVDTLIRIENHLDRWYPSTVVDVMSRAGQKDIGAVFAWLSSSTGNDLTDYHVIDEVHAGPEHPVAEWDVENLLPMKELWEGTQPILESLKNYTQTFRSDPNGTMTTILDLLDRRATEEPIK